MKNLFLTVKYWIKAIYARIRGYKWWYVNCGLVTGEVVENIVLAKDSADAQRKSIKSISSSTGIPESDLYIFECMETTDKAIIKDE